jgi:alkylhydroperoxidase/carboxymuconolactone decarboxylase family protein YurZ
MHPKHEESPVADYKDILRRLTIGDEALSRSILALGPEGCDGAHLEPKVYELVRLGALIALDADAASYQPVTAAALAMGARPEEIVGTLAAVAPIAGLARTVAAAPSLAAAIGYNVDEALETLEDD